MGLFVNKRLAFLTLFLADFCYNRGGRLARANLVPTRSGPKGSSRNIFDSGHVQSPTCAGLNFRTPHC